QLIDVLVEIGPARRLHAIGVAAKEDGIEVELEDLLLAQGRFEPESEDRLADLAADIVARILQQIFGDLLSDGGAAACAAAGHRLAAIVEDRADQGGIGDTAMLEEGRVLCRND